MMIPPTIDLPPGFQERTPITSTAFDQAYQSSIAFGTANLPQNRSRFAAKPQIPIGGHSAASIIIRYRTIA